MLRVTHSTSRYTFKPDPYSSHSVMLEWLGQGQGRMLLDVGAADGLLSRRFTERGWRVTGLEYDPVAAQAASRWCERVVVANLDREIPSSRTSTTSSCTATCSSTSRTRFASSPA